jgi:hypothetical protein
MTRPVTAAVVAADLVTAFGFVVAFNQLGTQSAVDAILPVAVFSVGIAGVVMLVAALLGAAAPDRDEAERLPPAGSAHLRSFPPPTLERGFAAFGIGVLGLAAAGWQWGVAAQAMAAAALGIALLLETARGIVLILRGDPHRPSTFRLCLTAPEAALLIGFAWAALADAGIKPFA